MFRTVYILHDGKQWYLHAICTTGENAYGLFPSSWTCSGRPTPVIRKLDSLDTKV